MRILLTGPTGFIGANFLRQALGQSHQMAALLLPGETLPRDLEGQASLNTLLGTLAEPPWSKIEAFQPESCVHTAWITTPGIYLESPENDRFLAWSIAFAEKFYQIGGQHFMALGSCAEYRPVRRPLAETEFPLNDSTRYARCKTALREALEKMATKPGCGCCWGRVFYPFGIGEHPARLCSSLISQIGRSQAVTLKTPESTKDYIYIDDLASAILWVVENHCCGTINLGTGKGVTVRQIAQLIAGWMGHSELVTETPQSAPDPLDYMVADASKLQQLGWRETVGFAPGLRRLWQQLLPDRQPIPHQ